MHSKPSVLPPAWVRAWESAGMLLVLAALFLGCSLLVDNFLSVATCAAWPWRWRRSAWCLRRDRCLPQGDLDVR